MKFSERMGLKITNIQFESMDERLTNGIWNVLHENFGSSILSALKSPNILCDKLWTNFFRYKSNEKPVNCKNILFFENIYYKLSWHEKYDFVEFIIENCDPELTNRLIAELNDVLAEEKSGYRLVNKQFVPILNAEQINSIENASFNKHIDTAVRELSINGRSDNRTVIKESIDAVEDMCTQITKADPNAKDQDTLGQALKEIEKHSGIELHPSLKAAFSKIYGYASDGGIRHAQGDNAPPDQETAIFMLVSCSAFVNYLQVKADKAGIDLK